MGEAKYVISEGEVVIKTPNQPEPKDYYDVTETEEEREERINSYSEVKENE